MMKIGILQTAFLGDTILLSTLFESIKNYNKDYEIYLIVKKGNEDIFKYDPRVKTTLIYDKKGKDSGLSGLIRISKEIKKLKLDILINVHRSIRSAILTKLSKAKKTIGFKLWFSFLFDKSVERIGIHEVYKNHLLLEALNKDFSNYKPSIDIGYKLYTDKTPKDKNLLNVVFTPFILIAPGSKWNTKRWIDYKKLTEELLKNPSYNNYNIIFTGDKNDQAYIDFVTPKNTSRIYKFTDLMLTDLFYLISRASVLITNDSAPQHIAAGFNIPTVVIFGPTTKKLGFYPFNKKAIVVENNEVSCRPCGLHGHMSCPKKHHRCMKEVSFLTVLEAIKKLLS